MSEKGSGIRNHFQNLGAGGNLAKKTKASLERGGLAPKEASEEISREINALGKATGRPESSKKGYVFADRRGGWGESHNNTPGEERDFKLRNPAQGQAGGYPFEKGGEKKGIWPGRKGNELGGETGRPPLFGAETRSSPNCRCGESQLRRGDLGTQKGTGKKFADPVTSGRVRNWAAIKNGRMRCLKRKKG